MKARQFNPSKIKKPTVNVVRWTTDWRVILWVPHYAYGLSHDCLYGLKDAQAAKRLGRRLAKLLNGDCIVEDLSGE